MPCDPLTVIGEVLGEPADQMRNPVNAGYHCPYTSSECNKRSQQVSGPYPVCSVYQRGNGRQTPQLICTCPARLYQADIMGDVIQHCWPGTPPANPRMAYEVIMEGQGKVDCVIADVQGSTIGQFVSVELQTVDITGSCFPAYDALINNRILNDAPTYSFNWKNVYKRYIMQLIFKGYYHAHWQTRIVAVMQDVLVERLWNIGNFQESVLDNSNVIFMSYKMVPDPADPDRHKLEFVRPIGTRHMDLMNAILYRTPPSRDEFIRKILQRM